MAEQNEGPHRRNAIRRNDVERYHENPIGQEERAAVRRERRAERGIPQALQNGHGVADGGGGERGDRRLNRRERIQQRAQGWWRRFVVLFQLLAFFVTPAAGKQEFMTVEKLFNRRTSGRRACSCSRWSPTSRRSYQKLREDFALVLDHEQMPFIGLIFEMVQIRARLLKSGGEDLKHFLNDSLLTVDPADRLISGGILESERFLKWCSQTVVEDKKFLQKHFIGEMDFSNRQKLATDGINFDCLESKNIPAMFYWDDRWKIVEHTDFVFKVGSADGQTVHGEKKFQFQELEPLVSFFFVLQESGVIGLADGIPAHMSAYLMTIELVERMGPRGKKDVNLLVNQVVSREFESAANFDGSRPPALQLQLFVTQRTRRRIPPNSFASPSSSFVDDSN
ncbi:Mitogen-activated protein kinase kinase kinase 4 [Aphelenchoides fujianensis]|nr:Mitogen-activated protein kinase kinase kinase 4 [Aphelenchoides fujianensis]